MPFDLDLWKQQTGQNLQHLSQRLDKFKQQQAPHLLYGFLSSMALAPLVTAWSTGEIIGVTTALAGIAGGVGGNLLANLVQQAKDEADLVQRVQAGLATDQATALRDALDEVLVQLAVLPTAQRHLAEAERAWFAETLRAELAQLGNLARFEASLVITGNVSGDAVAGDKVAGDKVLGDKFETHYHGPPRPEAAALRDSYLNRMLESCRPLSLAGIDPEAAAKAEARLNLSAVYTALLTLSPEHHQKLLQGDPAGREATRLSALAQLDRHSRLVLLGDPGSGKSTFVNFVAMCLAGEALGRSEANLARLTAPLPPDKPERNKDKEPEPQPWRHGPLLPVRIILRDFAARGLPPLGQEATAQDLWRFVLAELKAAALADFAEPLAQELFKRGGLILLDGLDEVPEAGQRRQQIKDAVEDFARTFKNCRLLITSRTYAYQQQQWRLPGFAEAVLAPFSRGQIDRFVDRWYEHIAALRGLASDDAQGRAVLLKRAIFDSDRLAGLAERPLLLTLMASLHAWRGGSLPDKREELYADTVELLLDWWESPKVVKDAQGRPTVEQPSLAEWLRVDREKVRALLDRLAYQAHAGQPALVGTADVAENELIGGLLRLSNNPDARPQRLVEYLSQRAGLLLPRGVAVYTFPHRTFQEYLAACHLTTLDEFAAETASLVRAEPNRWREVALLAGAKAARGMAAAIWLLVDELCGQAVEESYVTTTELLAALVAGQALVETANLAHLSAANQRRVDRVRGWLKQALAASDTLPATERVTAGQLLARLGDDRPGVGLQPLPPPNRGRAGEGVRLPDIAWREVPAGPFLMGSDKTKDERTRDNEQPQHEVTLPAYRISQYPVTNAQFEAFVAAGGYSQAAYWPEAQAVGYWQAGKFKGQFDDKPREGPYSFSEPFTLPNHPVVGVSWYEAVAFCRWLSEQTGQAIRLPTEAEWEKAARGGLPLSSEERGPGGEVRIYPWGDDPDPNKANYNDTGIGTTSAVGCFPNGVSPYGVEELSGNVWEWTLSLWGKDFNKPDFNYPYDPTDGREDLTAGNEVLRVVRGGAFHDGLNGVRCAFRIRFRPDDRLRSGGFRLVVSPF